MGFLSALGDTINSQFGIGENTSHSLDSLTSGKPDPYGRLGDFAKRVDKSAERNYLEDGFIRDIRPRKRSILYQQPDIYVVVKKRMFSSLVDNSRLDLLEEKERLLIAASKKLFQNKCRLIQAYEKLTKIEQFTVDTDRFNTFMGPAVFDLVQSLNIFGSPDTITGKTKAAIETLRKVMSYAQPGQLTNWTTNDWDAVFANNAGEGPGTFELTNVASVSTSTSVEWGKGSCKLTLEDPYNLLSISEKDIDQAITDVGNPMREGSFFKFATTELNNRIEELKRELAIQRRARQASNITFKISPGTVFSKRVKAIIDDEGREIKFEYSTGVQDAFSGLENASNFLEGAAAASNVFSTGSVQIDPIFLRGNDNSVVSANNQLTSDEQKKFTEIISNIFTLLDQFATSQREMKKNSAEVNYVRNRMRLLFNGKFILQPMDVVTVFMNSRTGEDQRLPGGFSKQTTAASGFNIGQRFDTIVKNINNSINELKDPFGTSSSTISFDDVERLATVGPDMPKWLWRQFRQDITSQPTGPCVFSGLVGGSGVNGRWNDGKWIVNVNCDDNASYFNKSQINIKPAADVFDSTIYDPLTPFDVSFDAATGMPITDISGGDYPPLLPENQLLLLSGLMNFQTGPQRGEPANEANLKKETGEFAFNKFIKVLHDPGGLKYRWKQGIQTLTKTGRPAAPSSLPQERSVLLTDQPFAGQDVMNVLSLLITGQPYNYGNFIKAAIANGNSLGRKDEASGVTAAETYIQGLLAEIDRSNAIWGNFVPFKKLVIPKNFDKFISEGQLDFATTNTKLTQKLKERAKVQDELVLMQGGFPLDPNSIGANANEQSTGDITGAVSQLNRKIASIDAEIKQLQDEYQKTINKNENVGITLVGNDVQANPSLSTVEDTGSSESQKQRDDLQLRRNLAKFTSRRFWQVRANDDQNLFIVDDQYDKNFDIQAFERRINGNINTFASEYSSIADQLNNVASLLGLEMFANTQGHIEVRPPAYNKVPSSVFFKMFQDRDTRGVKVFPEFLESLFFNQVQSVFNQIEITEDEIRLRAFALGAIDEDGVINFINEAGDTSFAFLTPGVDDPNSSGVIGGQDLRSFFAQADPEFGNESANKAITELNSGTIAETISSQLKIRKLFTTSTQADILRNTGNIRPEDQKQNIEKVRTRLRAKTGREPKTISQLFGNEKFRNAVNTKTVSELDRLNLLNQIGNMLSERQGLIKQAANVIKNISEGAAVNSPVQPAGENIFQGGLGNIIKSSNNNKTSRVLTTPFLNRETEIPQFLEHMIEYESDDDIGYQSGRRYILSPDRIISLEISENEPEFTMLSVSGVLGEGFVEPAGSLNTTAGGNAQTTAYAVDYDMWYQYGFRASKTIEAPFFSDPDSQCAPLAVSRLSQQRKNILRGSVEIAGYNEFHQPGDVVYIEDRGLLFYVSTVSHNFSYGKLSTTLTLTYGHSPGEYIPTMLDTIGHVLYNSRNSGVQYKTSRATTTGSSRSVGALIFDAGPVPPGEGAEEENTRIGENDDPLKLLLSGSHGQRNKDVLSNALFAISGSLNQVNFRRQTSKIKIVYYVDDTGSSGDMSQIADAVKDWLINPESEAPENLLGDGGLTPISFSKDGSGKQKTFGLNESDIIIEEVNITDSNKKTVKQVFPEIGEEPRKYTGSPSRAGISATLLLDNGVKLDKDGLKRKFAETIIDIFVDYRSATRTITESDGFSQQQQEDNEAVQEARNARADESGLLDEDGDFSVL